MTTPQIEIVLAGIATVLVAAAVTGRLAVLVRAPVVPLFVIAGVALGPGTPLVGPLLGGENAFLLFQLGMTAALFVLGLEFRIRDIVGAGAVAALATGIGGLFMLGLGFAAGRVLGLPPFASAVLGGVMAVSSTTLVLHMNREDAIPGSARRVVVGVTLFDDVAAAGLVALYSAVTLAGALSLAEIGGTLLRTMVLLIVFTALAVLVAPRLLHALARLSGDYPLAAGAIGLAVAAAVAGTLLGFSPGLGAFIMGAAAAQSQAWARIAHIAGRGREIALGFFFVSIGLLVSPSVLFANAPVIAVVAVLAIVGRAVASSAALFLVGEGLRDAVSAGTRLARFGEFSVVLAGVAGPDTPEGAFLFATAAGLCVASVLAARPLVAAGGAAVTMAERRLPVSVRTFSGAYGAWVRRARKRLGASSASGRQARHLATRLFVSAVIVGLIVNMGVVAARLLPDLLAPAVDHQDALFAIWIGATVLSIPPIVSASLSALSLSHILFRPSGEEGVLLKRAIGTVFVLVVFGFASIMALFLASGGLAPVELIVGVGAVVLLFVLLLWRSIDGFHRSVDAALHESFFGEGPPAVEGEARLESLIKVHPEGVEIRRILASAASGLVGLTLAEALRTRLAGLTVLSLKRAGATSPAPRPGERIEEGDVLVVAGEGREDEDTERGV